MNKDSVKTYKPFDDQHRNFTLIHNSLFDEVMPSLSANAWKVLCVIIRQTIGWNKWEDEISYSQLLEKSGIKSNTTIKKSAEELKSKGLVIITKQQDASGKGQLVNKYKLNKKFELEIKDKTYQEGMSETVIGGMPENGIVDQEGMSETVIGGMPETVETKDTVNNKDNNNNTSEDFEKMQAVEEPVVVDGFKSTNPPAKEERIGKSKEAEKASTPANGKANGKSNGGAGPIPPEIVATMNKIGIDSTSHYPIWNGLSQNETVDKSKDLINFYGLWYKCSQGVEQNPIGIGFVVTKLRDNVFPSASVKSRVKDLENKFKGVVFD